jgi:shikimate dehydrogenase
VVAATSAVVLGAGATAASAVAALRELGCYRPVVMARSAARAGGVQAAAERLGVEVRLVPLDRLTRAGAWDTPPEVVVSTLPAGAADPLLNPTVTEAVRRDRPVLLDVVYAPWPTPLASVWAGHGLPVVSGLSMLLHQAVAQVELMTGVPGPVAAMRGALEAEVRRRSGGCPP